MQKEIETEQFSYSIIRSKRRTMSLEIKKDGQVIVRAPQEITEIRINKFVEQKTDWVLQNLEKVRRRQEAEKNIPQFSEAKKNLYRRKAEGILRKRAIYFGKVIGVQFNRITIK